MKRVREEECFHLFPREHSDEQVIHRATRVREGRLLVRGKREREGTFLFFFYCCCRRVSCCRVARSTSREKKRNKMMLMMVMTMSRCWCDVRERKERSGRREGNRIREEEYVSVFTFLFPYSC